MTTAEAAAALGVNDSRVRQFVRDRVLHPRTEETRRGPVHWFAKAEVERLRDERARLAEERKLKKMGGRPLKQPKSDPGGSPLS